MVAVMLVVIAVMTAVVMAAAVTARAAVVAGRRAEAAMTAKGPKRRLRSGHGCDVATTACQHTQGASKLERCMRGRRG